MLPTLLYLSAPLLEDAAFLRPFFAAYPKLAGASVLLHAPLTGVPARTKLAGKRLSAYLSEAMVPSLALTSHQRGLITPTPEGQLLRWDLLEKLLQTINCLVLTPLQAAEETLATLRHQGSWNKVLLFAENSRSALGAQPVQLEQAADVERLLALFPEEERIIRLAGILRPATIAAASSFTQ